MKQLFNMFFVIGFLCVSVSLYAQKDTVDVSSDISEGNLNNAINDAIGTGTLDNTVFRLEPYGYYVLSAEVITPQSSHLDIWAPEPGTDQFSAPPQIVWTSSTAVTKDRMFGIQGDFTMRNVWVRSADVAGAQVGTCIQFDDDPINGNKGVFEGVIFEYFPAPPSPGGTINVLASHFKGTFINCYFRNCIDRQLRYYGRAVSFPYETEGWHNDSLYFENCTFANMGYVVMQEGAEYSDNVFFNHCTFINISMFTLESGWWYKLAVTNSIWVNAFMFGYIPAQGTAGSGCFDIQRVEDFGFTVPFTDQDRRILFTNSSYFLEPWLVDWQTTSSPWAIFLHNNRRDDEIPQPQPMLNEAALAFFDSISTETGLKAYPYMNRAEIYDSTDPGFINPPTNIDSIKVWLNKKWDTNTAHNWAWNLESGLNQEWPLPENLAYTNTMLQTAAMSGFPLGDLYHWWPAEYAQWETQKDAEWANILDMLENGITGIERIPGGSIPSEFTLSQNYPNPFNPTTQIKYSVPQTGQVSLKVYNTLGQEVATLYNGVQSAGNYRATFDGKGLASGLYLYRLKADKVSITKKFILMR